MTVVGRTGSMSAIAVRRRSLRHLELGDGAVGGLEAELVERGLQRLVVAPARVGRAAYGVDVGALLRQALLLEDRLCRGGDLQRARVVALELQRLDVRDLAVLDRDAHLGAAVLRVHGVAGGRAGGAGGAAAAR